MDFRICLPGCPLIPTKGNTKFEWTTDHKEAFDNIKRALQNALTLALPNVDKPLILYIEERKGVLRGVLAQELGP